MNSIELNARAVELRKKLGEDENSFVDAFALANQIQGLTVLMYPMGERISGICIKKENANLIAVNSAMSYGRQRFSLAHEFYHLYYDDAKGISISAKSFDTEKETEKMADCFASYFLAPYNALRTAVKRFEGHELVLKNVIDLEQQFGMSHKAMLWRLVKDGYIKQSQANSYSGSVLFHAKRYGYDEKLYLPLDASVQKRAYGNYILQAEELKQREIISVGKYEELLLDAFRYDIVYGDDEIEGRIDD